MVACIKMKSVFNLYEVLGNKNHFNVVDARLAE